MFHWPSEAPNCIFSSNAVYGPRGSTGISWRTSLFADLVVGKWALGAPRGAGETHSALMAAGRLLDHAKPRISDAPKRLSAWSRAYFKTMSPRRFHKEASTSTSRPEPLSRWSRVARCFAAGQPSYLCRQRRILRGGPARHLSVPP